jgi:hypothetical protein
MAATELLEASSPATLVNHCLRTYRYGLVLAERDGLTPDPEILYVAAALHDLGLTERFAGTVAFEEHGADVAHAFLAERGYPADRADLVADAIRLHTRRSTAEDPRPEVALVHLGAALDVFAIGRKRMPPGAVEEILAAHPRLSFDEAIIGYLTEQARRVPESFAGELVRSGVLRVGSQGGFPGKP